jgi:hypothetical protein
MDDKLIAYLERWQKGLASGPSAPMLAARYLSSNARERMHVIYESQPDPCQPEMLAYFLRADPPYASKILKREPWEMHKPPGRCVMPFILRVPPRQMSPVMEEFLTAYLWHEQVPVKQAAAGSLGRYGSPAAQKPLWDALRYFHDYWKNRKQEMNDQSQAAWLEEQIRNAIGRARNWVANRGELEKLGSLCLGDKCVAANNQDLVLLERWAAAIDSYGQQRPGYFGLRRAIQQSNQPAGGSRQARSVPEGIGFSPLDDWRPRTKRIGGSADSASSRQGGLSDQWSGPRSMTNS